MPRLRFVTFIGAFVVISQYCILRGRIWDISSLLHLSVDVIALILQQNRLRWYGHVLQKDDDDWVKKCKEYEVEGLRPRGRPKRTWKEVVREDCQARKLNKEDAMDRCKWRKVTKEVRWPGWVWAGECFFWYRPTRVVPDKRPLNGCCCCYCAVLVWVRPDSESVADVKGAWCLLLPVA